MVLDCIFKKKKKKILDIIFTVSEIHYTYYIALFCLFPPNILYLLHPVIYVYGHVYCTAAFKCFTELKFLIFTIVQKCYFNIFKEKK